MNASLLSSKAMDWQTPSNILDLVRSVDAIGLDPATSPGNPVGAKYCYAGTCLEDDGLALPWAGQGLVYCNPPYGRALPAWTEKMATEGAAGAEIIALLTARPDTRWWQEYVVTAHAIIFWRGRLRFVGARSAAPFPSALAYWGHRRGRFCDTFAPHGWVTSASYQVRLPGVR